MNNLSPVPLNKINLFGFHIWMKTNVSKRWWKKNIFFVFLEDKFYHNYCNFWTYWASNSRNGQITDFLNGFFNVMDFYRFSLDLNLLWMTKGRIFSSHEFKKWSIIFHSFDIHVWMEGSKNMARYTDQDGASGVINS